MIKTYTEQSHPDYRAEAADIDEQSSQSLAKQLADVAIQIEAHRKAAGTSQNAWARQWPGLGSQKTYSNIVQGVFGEISLEKNLPNYRAVLSAIRANVGSTGDEPLYEDLPGTEAVTLAALRLMHHEGTDRLILVLGGSGSGKTCAIKVLAAQGAGGSRLIRLEAGETWKSPRAALRRMLLGVGVPKAEIPSPLAEMEDKLIEVLNQQGRCVVAIDEAHHVSGCVLNLFKTLLNRTSIRLILAGMSTLFQKLRANASEEAKQLIHNRLFERIDLVGPDAETARSFLSRRLGGDGGWKEGTLGSIARTSVDCGHWSFLRRIVDQLGTSGNANPNDADLMAAAELARKEIA